MEAYENLANAIILQAVEDYRAALKRLKRDPHNTSARQTAREVEEFFLSDWFKALTDADGEMILNRLREGFGE